MRHLTLACLLLSLGCASVSSVSLKKPSGGDAAQLAAAGDAFYSAKDAATMKEAVAKALVAAPDAALSHELAAQYALLDGDERAAVSHLIAALTDETDADAILHMKLLFSLDWTGEETSRIQALLDALSQSSGSAEIRAYAAFRLTSLRRDLGGNEDEALARIHGRLPLAIIGSWDNDQGKGFDIPQPPENEPFDEKAEYEGMLRKVRWREDVPQGSGGVYQLREALQPSRFALAYATGVFNLSAPGTVELRLRTGDPYKVWVDGTLVAAVREVREYMFDQAVIPVQLAAGNHRVLIKSAGRDDNGWFLSARVTGPHGEDLPALSLLTANASTKETVAPQQKPIAPESLVDVRVSHLTAGSRADALRALWFRQAVGGAQAVREAERFVTSAPGSVFGRYNLALSLWSNAESGRASDVLLKLSSEVGKDLVTIASAHARLQSQQGLRQRARADLLALSQEHDVPTVHRELYILFDAEDWTEDECAEADKLSALTPGNAYATVRAAACQRKLGRDDKVESLLRAQLQLTPGDVSVLRELQDWARNRGRDRISEWAARELLTRYPQQVGSYVTLADVLERRQAYDEAASLLRSAMALSPDSSVPWKQLAQMEYRRGRKAEATAAWREALERDPDDERLANRLEFVSPEKPAAWMVDVPTEREIDAWVAEARKLKPQPGANYAFVSDHEVTQYKADGSTVSLVTEVLQSFNAEGRDALLKRSLGGRVRIRVAYAVDEEGRRIEPASVRDGQVRFRSLGERSTVVLQFRRDMSPRGVLGRNLAYYWTFQGLSDQREHAKFILYVPKGLELHEFLRGNIQKKVSETEAGRRIEWAAEGVKPANYESSMPPAGEVTALLHVSSVPSWDVFAKWTEALFQDALRDSPEVRALADQLFKGVTDPNEKLLRIQTFLMKEIRYEQDYESMIAGVKPHPAPMVLERRYGDCKDKTVLFMTLAKLAGVETHYALIRTRDWGPIHQEVPEQQFNHVIVYVPEQPGIAQARYFDPTADALDLVTLRTDDVGTTTFVLNPNARTWKLQEIPYQAPELNSSTMTLDIALGEDGSASAKVNQSLVGTDGSAVRRLARNPEVFKKLVQHFANAVFSGSDVQSTDKLPDPEDVRNPAQLAISLLAPNAAQKEGNALRFKLPHDVNPANYFKQAKRQHPLVLSVPKRFRWQGSVTLANANVSRAPAAAKFESACLDYNRTVTQESGVVKFDHALTFKCERIQPDAYPAAMQAAVEVQRMLDESVVLQTGVPVKAPKKVKVAPQASQTAP